MRLLLFSISLLIFCNLKAQNFSDCNCFLPPAVKNTCIDSNSTFKVKFRDSTSIAGAVRFKRLDIEKDNVQYIQICYQDNSSVKYRISDLESFVYSSIGPGCDPVEIPILPSWIYYMRDFGKEKIIENYDVLYVDLLGNGILDLQTTNTNFKSLLFGGEFMIGYGLTRDLSVLVGIGATIEGKRQYFPLKGELRYHLFVDDPTKQLINYKMMYYPSECKVRNIYDKSDTVFSLPPKFRKDMIVPLDMGTMLDSTEFWVPDVIVDTTTGMKHIIKPYVYLEGGTVIDGSFDGAGVDSPSPYFTINPEEYSEYMFGIGIGGYLWDWLNVSLGYRYMRLNYREPCKDANCFKYAIYTNDVMGLMLRAGFHIGLF